MPPVSRLVAKGSNPCFFYHEVHEPAQGRHYHKTCPQCKTLFYASWYTPAEPSPVTNKAARYPYPTGLDHPQYYQYSLETIYDKKLFLRYETELHFLKASVNGFCEVENYLQENGEGAAARCLRAPGRPGRPFLCRLSADAG